MQTVLAQTNPAVGILIFTLGGLAGAIFYLPFKKVKNWAWESYWAVYALFALLIVPLVLAVTTAPNFISVLKATPSDILLYCFLCGAAWGIGGLTWGLMIRYLGVGLGLALGCGLCSAAGSIVPKIIGGTFNTLFEDSAGISSLIGVAVSIVGIIFVGMAGMSKESELSEEEKKKTVAEFNFKLGITVAIFSGLMSSALNYGLQGGPVIEYKAQYGSETAVVQADQNAKPAEFAANPAAFYDSASGYWVAPERPEEETTASVTWKGMPVLVVALLGGFVINFGWCIFLNLKNKTLGDYARKDAPFVGNLVFAGLAGVIWCSQFICFKTGEPAMGPTSYVGWSVLMASAILFSSLLGIGMGEWKGTSAKTRQLLAVGLILLVASSAIAGYSGYLSNDKPADSATVQSDTPAAVMEAGDPTANQGPVPMNTDNP